MFTDNKRVKSGKNSKEWLNTPIIRESTTRKSTRLQVKNAKHRFNVNIDAELRKPAFWIYIYSMPFVPQANTDKYALAHICIANGNGQNGERVARSLLFAKS